MALIPKSKWFGFCPPFLSQGQYMTFRMDEKLIKNDLLQLLLTSPGERVMRPDFGTLLRQYLFNNSTKETLILLRENILEAIRKYEQRISIKKFVIRGNPDKNEVIIDLYCSLVNDPNFVFELQLGIPIGQGKPEVKV